MRFPSSGLAAVAILVPVCSAALSALEIAVQQRQRNDLMVRDLGEHQLEKRVSTTFSLEQTLENQVLFDGNADALSLLSIVAPPVTIVCAKCCTTGEVEASFSIDDIVKPKLRFDLRGASAFIELDVVAKGGTTFTLPLFVSPPSPLGFSIPGGPSLGLTFQINLIFSLQAELDLHGGFYIKLPEDAFFEASLTDGTLGDLGLDGITSQSLPLTVNNNGTSGTFQVDLQLKAQVGIDATSSFIPGLDGFGAQAVVGVFVNLVEFIAELAITDDCALQASELFDVNVGAFLEADVQVAGKTFGAVPTVSTTLFEKDIGTQCLVSAGLPFPTRTADLVTTPAPADCTGLPSIVGNLTRTLGSPPPITRTIGSIPTIGRNTYLPPGTIQTIGRNTYRPSPPPTSTATIHPYNPYHHNGAGVFRRTNHSSPAAPVPGPPGALTTTTLTITTCGAAVPNCPASLQGEVEVTQTLCATASSSSAAPLRGVCGIFPNATTLESLSVPVTSTLDPGKIYTGGGSRNGSASATAVSTGFNETAPLVTATATATASEVFVPGTAFGTPVGTDVGSGSLPVQTAGAGRVGRAPWAGVGAGAVMGVLVLLL